MRGKGKIVSAKWIDNCFSEQKRLPWRRFAVDRDDKAGDVSEEEILCEWLRPKATNDSDDSDGDMLIVDNRTGEKKSSPEKKIEMKVDDSDDEDMMVVVKPPASPPKITIDNSDSETEKTHDDEQKENDNLQQNAFDFDSESSIDYSTVECEAFKNKIFYLNKDLPATTLLKFIHVIKHMLGIVTKDASKANYIITRHGKNLPRNSTAEVVKDTWIQECHDLQAFIPTTRYKL